MAEQYSVTLGQIIKEFSLSPLFMPAEPKNILVTNASVNRPGLALVGFYDHYERDRIQIIGRVEHFYLLEMGGEQRTEALNKLFATRPVAVVITSDLPVDPKTTQLAVSYGVPLLLSHEDTSTFMAGLIAYLNVQLAPRVTRHGVLMEVYGEGVLLLGDSGIGKSETAIELIKRGHRLIADDAVEIKRVSSKSLVGEAPELIRYYMELRGIGLVDIRRLFGMGAVKATEKIDLVIHLEPWEDSKLYDRVGLEEQFTEILGIRVPSVTIPVRPGRNLAIIIEIGAMNNRQKKMGYHTAQEFNRRLLGSMGIQPEDI